MTEELLGKLQEARASGEACALVTLAEAKGSTPRAAGAKMLVYADGRTWGTIGGGKFEALVVEASMAALADGAPVLKIFPLHEADAASFGAICGGEVTVLIEPCKAQDRMVLVGAGHCGAAVARLAKECGFHVTLLDDRPQSEIGAPVADRLILGRPPASAVAGEEWPERAALVLVSRNYEVDREALAAALSHRNFTYIGMIGSRRKVERVFAELRERGIPDDALGRVHAPIGLDIGADSPAEIAVSVMAEVLLVLRARSGLHLRERG